MAVSCRELRRRRSREREREGGLIMGGLFMSPWFQCDADAASKVSDSVAMDTLKL